MTFIGQRVVSLLVACLIVFTPVAAVAQWLSWFRKPSWTLDDRAYYEPLLSEPRAARIQLVIPSWSDEFEYQETPGRHYTCRLPWDASCPLLGGKRPVSIKTNGRGRAKGPSVSGFRYLFT